MACLPAIRRVARSTASKTRHCPISVSELETDGITAAWAALERWRPACGSPEVWAVRAARWAMFARRRFGYGARMTERSTSNNLGLQCVALDWAPEAELVAPEPSEPGLDREAWGEQVLKAMTTRQAQCVRLHVWEGQTSWQIAHELGIDAAVVRRHIQRGLETAALALGADPARVNWRALRG